jgi:hypothetical protein
METPPPGRTHRTGAEQDGPQLLTWAEFDHVTDVVADIAVARLDTAREDAIMACELLDRLAALRHLMTEPPDLRLRWRC